jgi:hypothetical protein
MPHSGQAGFLNIKPTFGQQFAQKTFLHRGHCHAAGFMNPPTCLPQTPQKPLTIVIPKNISLSYNLKFAISE